MRKRDRKPRDVGFKECCGEVCDGHCLARSVREREFRRRVSSSGVLRVI